MTVQQFVRLGVAAATVLLVGCQGNQKEPVRSTSQGSSSMSASGDLASKNDQALVRFVNALPGSSGTTAFVDNARTFEDVSFKTVTPYKQVPDGRHNVRVGEAAQSGGSGSENRNSTSESFTGGNYYTVVGHPDEESGMPAVTIIRDNFPSPNSDKAKIRIVDAAPSIGKVDVFARGKKDALFRNVGSVDGDYDEVDPMTGTLEIRRAGKLTALATVPSASYEAGKSYTIILSNSSKGSQKIEAITVEDHLVGGHDTVSPQGANSSYDND